jgi:hypothetical protein
VLGQHLPGWARWGTGGVPKGEGQVLWGVIRSGLQMRSNDDSSNDGVSNKEVKLLMRSTQSSIVSRSTMQTATLAPCPSHAEYTVQAMHIPDVHLLAAVDSQSQTFYMLHMQALCQPNHLVYTRHDRPRHTQPSSLQLLPATVQTTSTAQP